MPLNVEYPAGTGKMTTDYENIAFERDKEIIEKNQSENIVH